MSLFRKLSVVESEEPESTAAPFPEARVPDRLFDADRQSSYEKAAASIGFSPTELTRVQLTDFFATEAIRIYSCDQVHVWLAERRVAANVGPWNWRPLRERDIIKEYSWGKPEQDGYYDPTKHPWACRLYGRLVPQSALEITAKIEARFGDRVRFFVTSCNAPDAATFIMARPTNVDDGPIWDYQFVFGTWGKLGAIE